MTDLRPYQETGARFLGSRKAALLADEMGLGKCAQAIRACDDAFEDNVLVVCPASVRETWRREFQKFSLTGIVPNVVSYEEVLRDNWNVDLFTGGTLILDEAHYLKNAASKRTRSIFGEDCAGDGLVGRAKRVICLSGTPFPNHPAEMWPVLRALAPEVITGSSGRPNSYWQFVKKFCTTKDNGFGITITGGKKHDELQAKLAPFMLRRLKREVLTELPPIQFDNLYVEGRIDHSAESKSEEWAIERILREEGVEGLAKAASHMATLRRLTGLAKVAPCVDWIRDFVEGGRKLVVFAHHRDVIHALNTAPALNKVLRCCVTGDTPQFKRQEHIDAFRDRDGAAVFIGQLQAAGVGINGLEVADDALLVESSWVPSDNAQAAARIHRGSKTRACSVRFATLAGSIDENIQRALIRKTRDIGKILDGV